MVQYEHLLESSYDFSALEEYLELEIDSTVREYFVGSLKMGKEEKLWAPKLDLMLVRFATRAVAPKFGYSLVW
ncbi:hypothetical protein [Pseudohaliea sp.]|uniref:hypothetical protein n=1 Tax=Pseudohaliea sp. TaxID=2740289 RepID=UPI0032EAF082